MYENPYFFGRSGSCYIFATFSLFSQLFHYFSKIFIKHKYYNEEFTKEEAINFLLKYTFLDIDSSNKVLSQIIHDYSENNLEYYAAYIYIENLFNKNCLIDNKIPYYSFIEKIFKYGFLPVYNYKSILN